MRQDQFRIKKLREREARKKTITVGSRKNEKLPKMQKLNSCDHNVVKARKIKLKKQTAPPSPEPDMKYQL